LIESIEELAYKLKELESVVTRKEEIISEDTSLKGAIEEHQEKNEIQVEENI
jgi:hypothetical protein